MNFYLLPVTEEQRIEILNKHEYTEKDVDSLHLIGNSIACLVEAMIGYHTENSGIPGTDADVELGSYNILEMLIKPINDFLFEGAKVAKDKPENQEGEEA